MRPFPIALAIALAAGSASAAPFVNPQAWTTSAPGAVKTGGTLRFSRFQEEATINPFYQRVNGSIDTLIAAGGLFLRDPVTKKWVPYMAESYTMSADKRTFTVNIRKGMKWSDGRPITADDWLFTARVNLDEKFETENYDAYIVDDKPVRLSKVDADTLRITFPSVIGTALYQMAIMDVQPAHVFEPIAARGPAALRAAWSLGTPPSEIVSSGPFRFTGYRAGERATFVKNPYYGEWNVDAAGRPLPYLDGMVESIFRDQNAEFAAFLAGQTDIFQPRGTDDLAQLTRTVQAGNLRAVLKPNLSSEATGDRIAFNWNRASDPWKQALFRNIDFRRAMSHLANRAAMVEIGIGGLGTPIYSHVYPVLSQFQSPNLKRYEFNPEAAVALLRKIGFTRKNAEGTLVDRTGRALEFDLSPNAGNTRRAAEAQIFADEARKVGVKVNVRPVDFGTWSDLLDSDGPDRRFDAIIYGIVGGDQDLPFSVSLVGCKGSLTAWNKSGACLFPFETQMGAILNRARRELDDERRRALILQLQDIETANLASVFLISPNFHAAWNARLQGEFPQAIANSLTASRTFGPRALDLTWINE